MKIKNFELFAKRFAKEIGTTIKRKACDKNAVWFDNGYCMEVDNDSFIYIADCNTDNPITIMDTFACVYNTQKDFFRKFKMIISTMEEPEATETEETEALDETDRKTLDEKWHTYLSVYRDLQQTLAHARKCKTPRTYDICIGKYIKRLRAMYAEKKISKFMLYFIESKISMQNAESGIWASEYERATGCHPSRRYNKSSVDTE